MKWNLPVRVAFRLLTARPRPPPNPGDQATDSQHSTVSVSKFILVDDTVSGPYFWNC